MNGLLRNMARFFALINEVDDRLPDTFPLYFRCDKECVLY